MEQDTQKILEFVNSKRSIFLEKLKFSEKSQLFLTQLISNCKSEYESDKKFPQTNIESRFIESNYPFEKSISHSTIPEIIDAKINSLRKYLYKSTVLIYGRTYNFNIILFPKRQSFNVLENEAKEIVDQACFWLRIGTKYAPMNCSKYVDVFFYMTDEKKVLPHYKHDYVDMLHVNTAFTTSCTTNTQITLFRKEEWFKVFIHESFHNLGLDFSQYFQPNATVNSEILKIFPINSDIRLYESYCEMWAEIMNVIIINVFAHSRTNSKNMIVRIEHDMQCEQMYSYFQMAKLMDHFGINYQDLFDMNPKSVEKRKQYREKTAVFSYFVAKSILMYNINGFLEWCFVNNQGSFGFKNPDTNVLKYARELVISKHRDPKYLKIIENIENAFFSPKIRIKNSKFIYENLRMSVFG